MSGKPRPARERLLARMIAGDKLFFSTRANAGWVSYGVMPTKKHPAGALTTTGHWDARTVGALIESGDLTRVCPHNGTPYYLLTCDLEESKT